METARAMPPARWRLILPRHGGFAIDGRTTHHLGYAESINGRRGMETVFGWGWIKAIGGLRQFKVHGTEKVRAVFGLKVIAYNLIQLGNLLRPAMLAAGTGGCSGVWPGADHQTAPKGREH